MQGAFYFYENQSTRPRKPERLFFCLMPDEETARRVARFGDHFFGENGLPGTRLKTERLHLSLHHVGDYPRLKTKFVYAAQRSGMATLAAPVEVNFRSITSFREVSHRKSRRPLVLLGEGDDLQRLFLTLGAEMTRNGLKAANMFTPHMTLSYGDQLVPSQTISPIRFVAKEFMLIHSRLGLTQYEVIDRWPLRA